MSDFPTISSTGKPDAHRATYADDPTIRVQFDGGYEETRARYTRLRGQWTVQYHNLSQADKETLDAFFAARGLGGDAFNWTHPATGDSHSVRLAGVTNSWPTAPLMGADITRWEMSFTLREV